MAKKKNDDSAVDSSDFPKKWEKHLPADFKETAEAMSEEDLQKVIVDSSTQIADIERDLDADQSIQDLKAELKDLVGGYKDVIKLHEAKQRYAVYVRACRGKS